MTQLATARAQNLQCDIQAETCRRILVVNCEPTIVEYLRASLGDDGFQMEVAADGPAAFDRMHESSFDLVILDVAQPGIDGIEICKRIRVAWDVPILMLTACGDVPFRVMGLDLAADDYIVKPVGFAELLARARALLRRRAIAAPRAVLHSADLRIDRTSKMVERAGRPIRLTAKEFALLDFFTSNPRQVFDRQAILARVWGSAFAGGANLVDVHVGHLRGKLGDRPPRLLRTVRGVGYVWREEI